MVFERIRRGLSRIFRREAPPSKVPTGASRVFSSMEEAAYMSYRKNIIESGMEELLFEPGRRPHEYYTHTEFDIPTDYQSVYKYSYYDEDVEDYVEKYASVYHDEPLQYEEEEELMKEMAENYGIDLSEFRYEFIGGRTRLPEFVEI